jgi:hypothetical protein
MRTSILVWSTVSGALLGLFIDATLLGVVVLVSTVVPALGTRLQNRWFAIPAVVLLAVIPTAMAVLGFLEGQLKTR